MKKCPKCKDTPYCLTELWNGHTIEFTITDGEISQDGVQEVGFPCGVIANCKCGHFWRLRGITQITDIAEWEEK